MGSVKYKVGDSVIGITEAYHTLGVEGIVRVVGDSGRSIGIEWNKPVRGHNLDGTISSRRGLWLSENCFKPSQREWDE